MKQSLSLVVVCAAAMSFAAEALDLGGTWQVELAESTRAAVTLPGTLGDAKLGPAATEAVYGALTPKHQYVGKAVYSRTVTVTPEMTGEYEIFLERVMWRSEATFDGIALGDTDSLAAPHTYRVPKALMTPGEHTITLEIDNSMIYPIGEKSHSYGDSMQTRWNGVIGEMVLRPVNPMRGARVFAPYGDVVTVLYPTKCQPTLSIEGVATEVVSQAPGKTVLKVPGAKPWSEFDPQLYTLVTEWEGMEHKIRFGFRTFEVKGNRVYMNGRPFFVRGNTDNCHFPLTGYPAMDKATWKELLAKMQAEGINQVRCHTWATPKAAFDAADELGLLISPEVLWIDGWMVRDYPWLKGVGRGPKAVDTFVHNELFRILDAYGNAPSFFSLSVGNELGSSDFALLGKWMEECKAYDPRHLYAASSARAISHGDDFYVTHSYPGIGMVREWRREGTDWDYESAYSRTQLPTVAHEIGQWPVFPNFERELPKYTGILRPWNLEGLKELSEKAGVLRFNEAYAVASLKTCLLMYKDEIESFMRTPSCAGLQLLGIQDYSGQGEALIGWFDSFYDRKPGAEAMLPVPNYFAPQACLARFAKYTWTTDEVFTAKLVIHNYGQTAIQGQIPWSLGAAEGEVEVNVPVGGVQEVAQISVPLAEVAAPAKMELTFGNNKWPLWVYPAEISEAVPENVLYTDNLEDLTEAVAEGTQRILFDASLCANPEATIYSSFIPVYWGTTWFPGQRATTLGMVVQAESGAFENFPTEDWQDWQWQHLVNGAKTFRLSGTDANFVPLAMPVVDFHKPALAGLLFETKVGDATVLVSGIKLNANRPEAKQLKRSLLDYVASDDFDPVGSMDPETFAGLFYDARANMAPRPAEFANAVGYIECAAFSGEKFADVPWSKTLDRAELTAGTYALAGKDARTWTDNDGAYWVGTDFTVTLTGATNVRGKLLVRFRDPDSGGARRAEGTFDGGRTFTVPAHGKTEANPTGEHWVTLPVDMEDFLDGKLELRIRKTGGVNVMIDRIILIPNEA